MDSLTHTLTGAVIAKAVGDERIGPWGTVAGLAAGIFPDTDFVLGLIDRQFYLQYHRDFTHSLLLLPFYALFFGWLFVKISKRPHFWSFYKVCVLVLVSHVLLDLFTSYGTMIFSPFFNHRYAWDLLFIIDFVFTGILLIPWLTGLIWKRKALWLCRGALAMAAVYVLLCWSQQLRAKDLAKDFAIHLPEGTSHVASLPQPLSPFRWANYVETGDRVYQGFVDFLRKDLPADRPREIPVDGSGPLGRFKRWRRLEGLYDPPSEIRYRSYQKRDGSPWVEKALATEGARFYLWFARFPVLRAVQSENGIHRVEFMDVRFYVPGMGLAFVYYVELDGSGKVRSEGFVRGQKGS